jgi:hypothetical protein
MLEDVFLPKMKEFERRMAHWFMDAYRVPLSGKAAAWEVRKQKGHRTIAMMHLDAVVNPT